MFDYNDIITAVENAKKAECNYCNGFCELNPDNTEQRIRDKIIALAAMDAVLREFYKLYPLKNKAV